ncbi:MAG: HU family DNA-binding protein [Tannerella sp.]|jgi:nucleoid DNA-binding protein|nr:HU family DNA-binding protein [Tannerella sp.]
MKETELTAELSVRLNWEKQEVEAMLAALGHVIGEKLSGNDIIHLHRLGQFESKKQNERAYVNPTNGKHSLSPPKLIAVFRPATALRTYLKTLDSNHE